LKVSELTLNSLLPFITGDGAPTPRLSGPSLVKFFHAFGVYDEYSSKVGEGLPNGWSRNLYAYEVLKKLNGKNEFKLLVESLADTRKVNNPDEIASLINELIKHDDYTLIKNDIGIYKLTRANIEDPLVIEAHFQEIKSQIINSIRSAKFTIWVAVAWFTDKDLGNELWKKHKSGVNVRVIVNDDQTTEQHGLKFDQHGIDYVKISPISPWGKKLMHNKFSIIDICKVIQGSYNWTSNAQYNNESIIITEGREIAEEFSIQFIELLNQNRPNL
jgi:hypothetical protein